MDLKRYIKLSYALEELAYEFGYTVSVSRTMMQLYITGCDQVLDIVEDTDSSLVVDRKRFNEVVETFKKEG